MKAYRRLQGFLLIFIGSLLVIGYIALPFPGNEIFPFYSWSMFSFVPANETGYTILLLESGGKIFDPPLEFQNAGKWVGDQNSIVAFRTIQKLGAAYEAKNQLEVSNLRGLLEKNFLYSGARYELVKTIYDPLVRWKTGKRSMEVLQEWVRED